ncbi:paraquat-inducible membrane protein A [Ralstonia solanacearum]|uniref:paraquat-inducible protein A n=1 Tax=Ralstonia pseudosolanacearum TaxID=1310165 RepID=UPI000C9FB703|nr:paraquat-inducible protein A [Ralstonia pseudosolanacearum]AUS43373.1 paraquat-inducible membrane protein A [Ralstonia solanacearum]
METFPELMVCHACDAVYRRPVLAPGESAHCETCEANLQRASRLGIDGWLALTVAAAIAYAIANVCPVILVDMRGARNTATLWQSAAALAHGAAAAIAVPTAMAVIVVPLVQIALLGWVLAHARAGRRAAGFATAMRLLVALRPWSMVEVALLGILVAMIKLSGYLQVAPGAGVWALVALMILITLITRRDFQPLWDATWHGARRCV